MADISENNILNLHRDPSIRSVSGLHLQFLQRFKANNLIPQKILEGVQCTQHFHFLLATTATTLWGTGMAGQRLLSINMLFLLTREIYLLLNLNVYISPISFLSKMHLWVTSGLTANLHLAVGCIGRGNYGRFQGGH